MLSTNPKIVHHPHPILTNRICGSVGTVEAYVFTDALRSVIAELREEGNQPLGLAAPQIGYARRIFIAEGQVYINPWIRWRSKRQQTDEEACYSVEEVYNVKRAYSLIMEWQDLDGGTHKQRFTGFPARVIQHEYDHIECKLINGASFES